MFDLKKHLMWSKLKVGAVITAALAVVLFTVLFAGSLENLFSNNITVFAQIKDVRGLKSGSPVWLSGVEIGSVKDIRLHPEHGTLVKLAISSDAAQFIKKDSMVTVMTMGLLGDKYVEISNGSQNSPKVGPNDMLMGKVQLEMGDIVEATAGSLAKVSDVIGQLDSIVRKIDNKEGSVGLLLNDPSLYNNLKESTRSLSVTLREIETSNGSFRKLVKDPSLYDNLDKTSRKLAAVIDGVEQGKGAAGVLLKDDKMGKELKDSVTGLSELVVELKDMVKDMKAHPKRYFKFSVL